MEPIVYSGLCAAFVLILLDKYYITDKVLTYGNYLFKTSWVDVCYFCWCFWVSAAICLLSGEYLAAFPATVLARFFHTVITKR